MAKTLKTGDMRRIHVDSFDDLWPEDKWAVLGRKDMRPIGAASRSYARFLKEVGERIAKIVHRTDKYVFVEVSK